MRREKLRARLASSAKHFHREYRIEQISPKVGLL